MLPFRIEWAAGSLDSTTPAVGSGAAAASAGSLSFSANQPAGLYFDLASLTKVIVTSSCLVERFLISGQDWLSFVNQPVSTLVTELAQGALAKTTVREFWEHRSGLPAHTLLFEPSRTAGLPRGSAVQTALEKIAQLPVQPVPTPVYSDLGYIILGIYLERLAGTDLLSLWERWRGQHLASAHQLRYFAELSPDQRAAIQPTEADRHALGQVNDDNAYSLGEVSSHAGLTGRVEDVWGWLHAIYKWQQAEPRLVSWLTGIRLEGQRFVFGWDTPTPLTPGADSQGGRDSPPLTRGHLGYTGTAFWFDPTSKRAGVLLTNRVYPRHNARSQQIIRELRTEFFTALWQNKNLGQGQWLENLKINLP